MCVYKVKEVNVMWFGGFAAVVMTFVMSSFCCFVITILLGTEHLTLLLGKHGPFSLSAGVIIFASGAVPHVEADQ